MPSVTQALADRIGWLHERMRRLEEEEENLRQQVKDLLGEPDGEIRGEKFKVTIRSYDQSVVNYAKILADLNVSRQKIRGNSRTITKTRFTVSRI